MRSEAALRPYRARSGVLARTASNGGPDRQARAGVFVRFLSCALDIGITYSRPFSPFPGQFVTYSPRVLEIMPAKTLGLSDFRDLAIFTAPHPSLAFRKFTVLARRTKQGRTLVNSGPFRFPSREMKFRCKNGAISCS